MAIDSRVKALYDALKADGADVGTEEEFNAYMFKPGKEGYQNRYAVYKAFKDDGADIGASYEEFGKWLGLQAVAPKPAAKPAATPAPKQTAAPKPTEYFKLRRGGVDFTVPTAEVNAAGGLGGWAKAHPGAPIRVYMSGKKADGTAFDGHVDFQRPTTAERIVVTNIQRSPLPFKEQPNLLHLRSLSSRGNLRPYSRWHSVSNWRGHKPTYSLLSTKASSRERTLPRAINWGQV